MKHGDTKKGGYRTSEYVTWMGIKQRCLNTNDTSYPRYGGRGITICDRWRENYSNFLEDMGRKPSPLHSIDREDNNGHYCKENCRWVLAPMQSRNRRTNNFITAFNTTKCVTDWAAQLGVSPATISNRIKSGWAPEDAVSTIPNDKRSKKLITTINGQLYNATEISRKFGIPRSTVSNRIKSGMSEADIVASPGLPPGRKTTTFIEFNGKRKTIKQWADYLGVSHKSLRERLRRGCLIETALKPRKL